MDTVEHDERQTAFIYFFSSVIVVITVLFSETKDPLPSPRMDWLVYENV